MEMQPLKDTNGVKKLNFWTNQAEENSSNFTDQEKLMKYQDKTTATTLIN